MPPKCITACKPVAAEIALVVACLEMYTIIMSVEIGLALEFLRAWCISDHSGTRMWIFPIWIVRLHVGLPVVATLEQLSADMTLVRCFLRCRPLTLLFDSVHAWQHTCGLYVSPPLVLVILQSDRIGDCARFWPLCLAIDVFTGRSRRRDTGRIGRQALRGHASLETVFVARCRMPLASIFYLHTGSVCKFGSMLRVGLGWRVRRRNR